MENLLQYIREKEPELPKQQRLLCRYICDKPFEASMLTIAELSAKAGVGTATVTRMVCSLGYSSYNQFKQDLRSQILSQATTSYPTYWSLYLDGSASSGVLGELDALTEVIQEMKTPMFSAQVEAAAHAILSAKRVFLLGLRTSAIPAACLEHRLSDEAIDVVALSRDPEYIFDRLLTIRPTDILVAFASKPAAKRTMDAIRLSQKREIPVILITTTPTFELSSNQSMILCVNDYVSGLPMLPTVIIAELLAREVGKLGGQKSASHYQQLEKLVQEEGLPVWDS